MVGSHGDDKDSPEDEGNRAPSIPPPSTFLSTPTVIFSGVDADVLARAEAMIAAMQDDYLVWAEEDVTTLFKALERLESGAGDLAATKDEVFRLAHDMKGQGGSFGYDLITLAGNRLCRFLEKTGDPLTVAQVEAVRIHAEAIRTVLSSRMQGNGGQFGEEMLAALDRAAQKALP